jgi:hypothetical protein
MYSSGPEWNGIGVAEEFGNVARNFSPRVGLVQFAAVDEDFALADLESSLRGRPMTRLRSRNIVSSFEFDGDDIGASGGVRKKPSLFTNLICPLR